MIDISGVQVLIVDDDEWLVDELSRRLEAAGCVLRIAGDGIAAIDSIDQQTPDVIILDIMLPGANGIGLLHELQSYSDTGKIPVIILSSSVESVDTKQLRPYGVVDVIDKSTMKPGDIVTAIRRSRGGSDEN